MRLFFRKMCLIHGKELLSNVASVSYLTTLFLRASLKPLEAVYQYLVPILSPVTDNLLFLNQRKGEKHSTKVYAGDMPVDLETDCIRRPSYHARFSSVYDMKINEELKWIFILSFH